MGLPNFGLKKTTTQLILSVRMKHSVGYITPQNPLNYSHKILQSIPKFLSSSKAVADSDTTGHYTTPDTPYSNIIIANNPIPITMTNGEVIRSTHMALLPQKELPTSACKAHISHK